MAGCSSSGDHSHKESKSSIIGRDENDVKTLMNKFKEWSPFGRDTEDLLAISNNDAAPVDIKEPMFSAQKDIEILEDMLNRFLPNASKGYCDTSKKRDRNTFASLYKIDMKTKTGQTTTLKADRNIVKCLFNAASSGRNVGLKELVKYEME